MICNKCNNAVPADSEYCPFCGNVIENAAPAINTVSDIKKGYTYLELKQWKDAEQIFKTAIVNNDNKAQAYIGKMLARRKTDSIDSLIAKNKNLSNDADFKLALKYADGEYADYLKECALTVDKKNKKRTVILSSVCVSVVVLALLSYFVFIPFGRNFYYKDLLSDGKAQKAAKSYTNSKWFEYDKKAKDLFYENGLKFVEAKDYKNAEACFEITKGYTDNENYYNYCKAQNLLADDDLESYNYFIDLGDFLDSKEILNTNEYFVMVNKLQGEWEQGEYIKKDTSDNADVNSIADSNSIIFNPSRVHISSATSGDIAYNESALKQRQLLIDDILVTRGDGDKYKLFLNNETIVIADVDGSNPNAVKIIDDKTIEYKDFKWEKVE